MNQKQMAAFAELMLTGSVSEAARNLGRTQPAISHLIAALESDLEMKLFERRGGRLHPVPEAQYLFEECKDLLNRFEMVSQNMKRMKAMERGELRIASMPGPSVFLLPELIAQQAGPNPDFKATVLSRSSEAVQQLVGAQQFDLGVADYREDAAKETASLEVEVFHFDCFCAVSKEGPLARKKTIRPDDVKDMPLASLFHEHHSFHATNEAFSASNCTINSRFQTQFFIPLLTYVEKDLAFAIVDPLTVESYHLYRGGDANIAFVPFRPVVEFSVALLTPAYRPASLVAEAFKRKIVAEFKRLGARAS